MVLVEAVTPVGSEGLRPKADSECVLVVNSQDDFHEMPSIRGLVG